MAPLVRAIPVERTRELRRAILRPHETLEELAAAEPPDAFTVGAFAGDELVAVGMIAPDGTAGGWRVRGMATIAEARGTGAGGAVLEALLAHAEGGGGARVWCNARTPAIPFYERAGFSVVSGQFDLPSIGPHCVMERSLRPARRPPRW